MYKELSLFDGVSEEEYYAMMKCFESEEKSFSAGEVILDYFENRNKVGIIKEGSACLVRIDIDGNRYILENLHEDDIFGETVAFSLCGKDSIFVECISDCEILFLEYEHITKRCENACTHHSILVQNMFKVISEKLRDISVRVEVLSNRTIRQKLLCYFNIQASAVASHYFELPFSLSALADYIAADRSAVMREIKNMKDEGLLETDRRMVKLKVKY